MHNRSQISTKYNEPTVMPSSSIHQPPKLDSRTFPKTKRSTPLLKRSIITTKHLTHQNATLFARMWRTAPHAPIYTQKAYQNVYSDVDGSKPQRQVVEGKFRRNGVFPKDLWSTLASGVSANNIRTEELFGTRLRADFDDESSSVPLLPSISLPAQMLMEQTGIAYLHKSGENALLLTNTLGRYKRITASAAQVGTDSLNVEVQAKRAMLPRNVVKYVSPKKKKRKSTHERPKTKP